MSRHSAPGQVPTSSLVPGHRYRVCKTCVPLHNPTQPWNAGHVASPSAQATRQPASGCQPSQPLRSSLAGLALPALASMVRLSCALVSLGSSCASAACRRLQACPAGYNPNCVSTSSNNDTYSPAWRAKGVTTVDAALQDLEAEFLGKIVRSLLCMHVVVHA